MAVDSLYHVHAVAQEFGNHLKWHPLHDHPGGAGMPQSMRGHILKSCRFDTLTEGMADAGHWATSKFDHAIAGANRRCFPQDFTQLWYDRHDSPFFVPGSRAVIDDVSLEINLVPLQLKDRACPCASVQSKLDKQADVRRSSHVQKPLYFGSCQPSLFRVGGRRCLYFGRSLDPSLVDGPAQSSPERDNLFDDCAVTQWFPVTSCASASLGAPFLRILPADLSGDMIRPEIPKVLVKGSARILY